MPTLLAMLATLGFARLREEGRASIGVAVV